MNSGVCTKDPRHVERNLVYFASAAAITAFGILATCTLSHRDAIILVLVICFCTLPLIYGFTHHDAHAIKWGHTAFSVSLFVMAFLIHATPIKVWFTLVVLLQVAWYIECNNNCPITVVCNSMKQSFDARVVVADVSPIVIILIEVALVVYIW